MICYNSGKKRKCETTRVSFARPNYTKSSFCIVGYIVLYNGAKGGLLSFPERIITLARFYMGKMKPFAKFRKYASLLSFFVSKILVSQIPIITRKPHIKPATGLV